jgi:hypothetical protein
MVFEIYQKGKKQPYNENLDEVAMASLAARRL